MISKGLTAVLEHKSAFQVSRWFANHTVGHSMGGLGKFVLHALLKFRLCRFVSKLMVVLVIKKAYMLARRDSATQSLAARVQCLMFLATLHRGADIASVLGNMLRATGVFGVKPFLSDLERDSPGLDMINDEFKHYADDVGFWSFYETVKLNMGVHSAIIVEKDSASIGLKHERILPLNADHRTVCKFDSVHDSNYIKVKSALASIVEDIISERSAKRDNGARSDLSALQSYFGVTSTPTNELENAQDNLAKGTYS
jgi:hypothetical protein